VELSPAPPGRSSYSTSAVKRLIPQTLACALVLCDLLRFSSHVVLLRIVRMDGGPDRVSSAESTAEDPSAPPRARIEAESEAESKVRDMASASCWATVLGPVLGGAIVGLSIYCTSKNVSADWQAIVGETMQAATAKWMEAVKRKT
jgi:hypothetical protein